MHPRSRSLRPRTALARQQRRLCALAAAYAAGPVRNHPLVDGNKRIAFMAAYLFLARNGRRLLAPEAEATAMMMGLAAGEIDEAAFAASLRATAPADALLRRRRGDQLGQAVVGERLDGGEVAVRDPLRPLELADVVADLAERQ